MLPSILKKVHRYKIVFLAVAILLVLDLRAQEKTHINTGKFILSTNGFGLGYSRYQEKNNSMFSVDLQTISHPQETNVQNSDIVNPRTYVYAKINSAASFRLGYTKYWYVNKGSEQSLSPQILMGATFGPSLGITKPYYIVYQHDREDGSDLDIIQQNQETLSNTDSIYGPVSWTKGFNQLAFSPGVHTDLHLAIKWKHSYYFQGCKVGVRFEYFPNQLEIMYNAENQIFSSIYFSYEVGR